MPEEIEVPTEHLHEHMERNAEESREKWVLGVALSSAFLAAFAAVAALMAGFHANEAMIDRIKSSVLGSKLELLKSLKKSVSDKDEEKMKQYKEDQDKISEEAKKDEEESEAHLKRHEALARSVTLFQLAIALGAISALTRRKPFWLVSLGFGGVGLFFFVMGFLG